MLEILTVEPGSIADELGVQPGDRLLAVNGELGNDLVDYLIEEPGEVLHIEIKRVDGELWDLDIEHDSDEPLGLGLPHPEPKQCGNNCIFCFVHQLPRGMRKTLYVKDEDYRFSYLYGAYVTLTNLSEEDLRPKHGVYVTQVVYEGKCYGGVLNIGYNPTFETPP